MPKKKQKAAASHRKSALRQMLERSVVLLPDERTFLLAKLPTMTPEELTELESILTASEAIRWEEELPAYERAVEEMVELSEETEMALHSLAS